MTDDCSHIGLDVGGAHLKMARINASGRVQAAAQWTTPLWQGLDALDRAVESIHGKLKTHEAGKIAVTMTGELVDYFRDRNQGVVDISRRIENCFGHESVRFYAGNRGFLESESCRNHVNEIASANWHGTTRYVASMIERGILFDLGSTTADIIPFGGGNVLASATTDHERLRTHELCYTGVVRTPVMA
ncbi:MAG: hydantoinase/oxoprolinase family protein, partial [Gammaproteobacteria bacterium]|nr:hydantoinase/oxoprolinase family protein [Gammaproteobacteria bacterium]